MIGKIYHIEEPERLKLPINIFSKRVYIFTHGKRGVDVYCGCVKLNMIQSCVVTQAVSFDIGGIRIHQAGVISPYCRFPTDHRFSRLRLIRESVKE